MTHTPTPPTQPDTASRKMLIFGGGLLLAIVAVFLIGRFSGLMDLDAMQATLQARASGPWGLPLLVLVFVAAAYIGVPQFALIALAVVAFGPLQGFIYAWIATLASGSTTFWTGRIAGEAMFRRFAGNTAQKLSSFVGRNAFATSAIIRNIPSGPFLLVNMAFGVSHARFTHYLAGLAVGCIPKLALVAFAGQSLMAALRGHPLAAIAAAAAAIALYAFVAIYLRRRVAARRQSVPLMGKAEVDTAPDTPENK